MLNLWLLLICLIIILISKLLITIIWCLLIILNILFYRKWRFTISLIILLLFLWLWFPYLLIIIRYENIIISRIYYIILLVWKFDLLICLLLWLYLSFFLNLLPRLLIYCSRSIKLIINWLFLYIFLMNCIMRS